VLARAHHRKGSLPILCGEGVLLRSTEILWLSDLVYPLNNKTISVFAALTDHFNQVLAHGQHSARRNTNTFHGLRVRTPLLFRESTSVRDTPVRDKFTCDTCSQLHFHGVMTEVYDMYIYICIYEIYIYIYVYLTYVYMQYIYIYMYM